jgi:hypothetical protein
VVSYNAWTDEQGAIGYQKKGPLHFGTLQNELQTEMEDLAAVFNRGVETHITHHIGDAAHCKLVINLTNSLTTLIGLNIKEISDQALFQKLLTNLTWEGVTVIRAAGYKESKLGGMPPWRLFWSGSHLPRAITKGMFEKNVKKWSSPAWPRTLSSAAAATRSWSPSTDTSSIWPKSTASARPTTRPCTIWPSRNSPSIRSSRWT